MRRSDPDTNATNAARALLGIALLGSIGGWLLFYFLTDDAFITFRYVSNSLAGRGLVWNPPPFRPVEGYTSFLWAIVLRQVWSLTGVEPPESSGVISLLFGWGTLVLAYGFVMRMQLPTAVARHRVTLLAVVLLGVLTNRTFLAWLSSGLETGMFNFLLIWFSYEALAPSKPRASTWWVVRLSSAAGLAALTRPDGMLAVACAVAILGPDMIERRSFRRLLGALPLAMLPLHLLWRHATYGEWLPNTYYAKSVGAWPESGVRYLASFVVEYGVWVWLAIMGVWLVVRLRMLPRPLLRSLWSARDTFLVVGMLVVHWAYYTFLIGGDHFEYRVYSHLIPLLWITAVWMLTRISSDARVIFAALAAFLLMSLPIPWVHWAESRELNLRRDTFRLALPISDRFVPPFDRIVARWDAWQHWLISHSVCMRHQEHKAFLLRRQAILPPREAGARISWDGRPVFFDGSVGVLGWTLPNVAIIDIVGLNDYVVARLPPPPHRSVGRQMAHDREAPKAYRNCFLPNLWIRLKPRQFSIDARALSDERIRDCESRDWLEAAHQEFGRAEDGAPDSNKSIPKIR